jgi:ubiquitin-protein ligase
MEKQLCSERIKRVMRELRNLHQNPHPAFDIYPSESDLTFWKVVITTTTTTTTGIQVIRGLIYIYFCGNYPIVAPEIRFISPVQHPAIKPSGWVCNNFLNQNWTPQTSVHTLLHILYNTFTHAVKNVQPFTTEHGRREQPIQRQPVHDPPSRDRLSRDTLCVISRNVDNKQVTKRSCTKRIYMSGEQDNELSMSRKRIKL